MSQPGKQGTASDDEAHQNAGNGANGWAADHGYALILGFGLLMVVSSVALMAADRDANFLVAGGTLLLLFGAISGRLSHLKLGREGLEADLTGQAVARELRRAEAAVERSEKEEDGDEAQVDPAKVLETAAAAVAAQSPQEREERLEQLRRVTSPMERMRQAIHWVMTLERAAGRAPKEAGSLDIADLSSPPRTIEVKAVRGPRPAMPFLRLTEREVEAAKSDPNFYLYVVEDTEVDGPERFSLKVFGGASLSELLESARRRVWYDVPIRSDVYRDAPGVEALRPTESRE